MWSLHVACDVWVFSGYFGFLPPFKDMGLVLTGDSKLLVTVNVSGLNFSPVVDCQPVQ